MSQERLPPAEPALCLVRPYASTQKGGTLIGEDVTDRATHERRIRSPDGYRPTWCAACGHGVLHVHDYRERKLFAELLIDPNELVAVITIVRYLCAKCGAIWRILPAFIARRIWRSWSVVEAVTVGAPPPPTQPEIPERTKRRWAERLASAARQLVQILATTAAATLETIASSVGLSSTREELVLAYAVATSAPPNRKLSNLAALIHRLSPGVRLM